MRTSEIKRKTGETDVFVQLKLDGKGETKTETGVGFLDHMLTLFGRHGGFDLTVTAKGDTYVDDHHTVEDVGIALGQALKKALGDCRGICRYGDITLPMDEALILAAVDISGRAYLACELEIRRRKVGTFDTELVEEFFHAFAGNAGLTLHLRQLAGRNTHHVIEGAFKAAARALRKAVAVDTRFAGDIPSTKGVL